MSLRGVIQTLFSVLEIVLNMEKLWEYFDCKLFKEKGCGSWACEDQCHFLH